MFIGEMGSWLFIAFFALQKRYNSRTTSAEENGYTAVDTDENGDAASIRSTTPINPAAKAMEVNDEGRLPLEGWKVTLLGLPAVCDICGTTLMNVGLLFVVPSIYQMTRGALVLFVGLFSVIFLRRKLHLFQWFALVTVVLGVAIVGLAGAIYKDHKAAPSAILLVREALTIVAREARTPEAIKTIIGVFLIAGAQIFTASQFVLEEYILEKYALEPLKVVGWEGLFGFLVTVLGMIILHLAIGRTDAGRYGYFDLVEGWRQITTYKSIGVSSILIMISIGYVSSSLSCFPPALIFQSHITNTIQRIQFLRSLCNPHRQCNIPLHNRHMQNPVHLDCLPLPRLGIVQIPPSCRFWPSGLWNVLVQWTCAPAFE
jgi:drug/metabolite transporter (DMT)-like permease